MPRATRGEPSLARLLRVLDTLRRRVARRQSRRWCVSLFAAFSLVALALVVMDHTVPSGMPRHVLVSIISVAAGGALVAAIGGLYVWRGSRCNPLYAALVAERAVDERHNAVINSVSLWRSQGETGLTAALAAQADRCLPDTAVASSLPLPRSRRMTWQLATVAAWVAYVLLAPKSVFDSLARLFGADLPPPTLVHIHLLRPNAQDRVHVGEPLSFEFAFSGTRVESAELTVAPTDAPPETAPRRLALTRDPSRADEARWGAVLAPHEVIGDIRFECRAGDARLAGTVRIWPRPTVAAWDILLTPPAYTGAPQFRVNDPELVVWPGTEARIGFEANTDLADPILVLQDATEYRVRMVIPADAPRRASGGVHLVRTGRFRVEFNDSSGFPQTEPAWHSILVRTDAVPSVRLVEPDPSEPINLQSCAALVAEADDDVAVTSLALVFRKAGDAIDHRVEPPIQPGRHTRTALASVGIQLADGESAEAWLEVRDNRVFPDGNAAPQLGRSGRFRLTRQRNNENSATVRQGASEAAGQGAADSNARSTGSGEGERTPERDSESGSESRETRQPEAQPGAGGDGATAGGTDGDESSQRSTASDDDFIRRHGDALRRISAAQSRPAADGEPASKRTGEGTAESDSRGADGPGSMPTPQAARDEETGGETEPSSDRKPRGESGDDRPGAPGESPSPAGDPQPPQPGGQSKNDDTTPARPEGAQPAAEAGADTDGTSADDPSQPDLNDPTRPGDHDPARPRNEGPTRPDRGEGHRPSGQDSTPSDRSEPPERGTQRAASGAPEAGSTSPAVGRSAASTPRQASTAGGEPSDPGSEASRSGSGARNRSDAAKPAEDGTTPHDDDRSNSRPQADQSGPPPPRRNGGNPDPTERPIAPRGGNGAPSDRSLGDAVDRDHTAGSSSPRDDANPQDSTLPETPPGPRAAGPIDTPGRPEQVDVLEMLKRRGDVPPELDERIGWTPGERTAFIRDLRRLIARERAAPSRTEPPEIRTLPFREIPPDGVLGPGVESLQSSRGPVRLRPDDARPFAPPPDQRVAPELRRVLNAYYKTMAQRQPRRP